MTDKDEAKHNVSLQIRKRNAACGRQTAEVVLSQLLSLAFALLSPHRGKRGLYLQTPQHRQTPAEPWGRSPVKMTTREKKTKNPPERCPLGLKLVISCLFFSFWSLQKKRGKEGITLLWVCHRSFFFSQYCHGTLIVFIAARRLNSEITQSKSRFQTHIWSIR